MGPIDPLRGSWRTVVGVALLLLLVAAAYLPLRHNEFVNFDDDRLILDNPALHDLSPAGLGDLLALQLFTPHYKPLVNLTWAAELRLFGPDPWAFHRHNLFLHLLNTLLLFALVTRLAGSERPSRAAVAAALAVAAIWALHPLRVESVAWASGRKDLLFTALYLAALLAYTRWIDDRRRRWLAASALLALAAMLSKGAAITLPAALFLVDLARRRRWQRGWLVEKLPHCGAALVALYLYGMLPGPGAAGGSLALLAGQDAAARLAGAAHRHLAFAGRWLAPTDLAPLYTVPPFLTRPEWPRLAAYALAHAALLAALLAALKRRPRLAAAALFYTLTLLPTLVAPISISNYLSDRYTYLPAVGLSALAVLALSGLWRRHGAARPALTAVLVVLCLGLAGLSRRQAGVWRDSETLWTHASLLEPPHPYAFNNRGAARRARGDDDGALADFESALELRPGYPAALANRAALLRRRGRAAEALADLDRALELAPSDPRLHLGRAQAHAALGRLEAARRDYDRALELAPHDAAALYQRAGVRRELGDLAGARDDIERALAQPARSSGEAHLLRATILAHQGDMAGALAAADQAVRLAPDDAVAHNNRGFLRLRLDDPAGALADLDRAIALRPGYALAWRSRGDALAALDRANDACAAWRTAARAGAPATASRLSACPGPPTPSPRSSPEP